MNIYVCIKQVPDTSEISINPETGTLNRAGVESVINPLDYNALEAALTLRKQYGGTVTALTMGPGQAEEALREAVAMGADSGVLCSDKKFAGADTWATACTLQAAVEVLGMPDLLLCGKQAIDGDTAQVPAELSVRLGIPFLPYVSEIHSIEENTIQVSSMTESGSVRLETTCPAVCSVVKSINVPRLISLSGWIRAFSEDTRQLGKNDIASADADIGLRGSPTRVKKITPVSHSKTIRYLEADRTEDLQTVFNIVKNAQIRETAGAESPSKKKPGGTENRGPNWTGILLASLENKNSQHRGLFILGEVDPETQAVSSVTFELLSEGKRLAEQKGTDLSLVLLSSREGIKWSAKDLQEIDKLGLEAVYWIETGLETGFEANCFAEAAAAFLKPAAPEIILAPATLAGRSYVPLLASRLATGLTADCTSFEIDSETGLLQQTRPAFGGNIMATIITPDHKPQMATVRPHVLQRNSGDTPSTAAERTLWHRFDMHQKDGMGEDYSAALTESTGRAEVKIIGRTKSIGHTEDIGNAPIIISGGRGVGGETKDENRGVPLLQEFARMVDGSVGASRSTVEAGWAPYHQQVGQTGKTVQPKVYIACGISGAVQHLVGMHDSDTIIAINKDPEAPIFQAADYGFVDDYSRVLNKLLELLSERVST